MAEEAVLDQEKIVEKKPEMQAGPNVKSFEGTEKAPEQKLPESKSEEKKLPENEEKKIEKKEDESVDTDEFLKKETGWETWDQAKAAKAELEELRTKKVETPKFSAEDRDKLFDDAYPVIQAKKQIERAEKLDVTKPREAAELVKLGMQLKNKDLSAEDVDFLYNERFAMPDKPKKGEDQTDEDHAEAMARYERQVESVNKRLAIEAKLAKPELSKFKAELVLPDIPKPEPVVQQPSEESLAAVKAIREGFLKAVDNDFAKFDGFTTKVKDESVEFPVSFKVSDEDKAEIKKIAQEMNIDEYFGKRWFDDKGNTKVEQMMSDLYLLEKRDKAFQGTANNAASERRKEIIKQNSNIKLNGVTNGQTNLKQSGTTKEKEEAAIWSA